jgi:hypothetical protein
LLDGHDKSPLQEQTMRQIEKVPEQSLGGLEGYSSCEIFQYGCGVTGNEFSKTVLSSAASSSCHSFGLSQNAPSDKVMVRSKFSLRTITDPDRQIVMWPYSCSCLGRP